MPTLVPARYLKDLETFPAPLRELLEAELAAGNTIEEVAGGFPAPPVGVYVKLAQMISTRPHVSDEFIHYYDRNSSVYSGEWADPRRFYFLLEPRRPAPPEVDMDAIRARLNAPAGRPASPPAHLSRQGAARETSSLVSRFRESMVIDYDKWHDGIGYDVALLRDLTADDRAAIEDLLLRRGINDWRDVEAFAAIGSEACLHALRIAGLGATSEVRAAVRKAAPALVSPEQKLTGILEGLRTAKFFGGLTPVLDEVETFHPPVAVAELFRGLLERSGEVAVHFAAMLMFIHGKTEEPFDWDQRPFFLQFATENRTERVAAIRELCEKIGVDPKTVLPADG